MPKSPPIKISTPLDEGAPIYFGHNCRRNNPQEIVKCLRDCASAKIGTIRTTEPTGQFSDNKNQDIVIVRDDQDKEIFSFAKPHESAFAKHEISAQLIISDQITGFVEIQNRYMPYFDWKDATLKSSIIPMMQRIFEQIADIIEKNETPPKDSGPLAPPSKILAVLAAADMLEDVYYLMRAGTELSELGTNSDDINVKSFLRAFNESYPPYDSIHLDDYHVVISADEIFYEPETPSPIEILNIMSDLYISSNIKLWFPNANT